MFDCVDSSLDKVGSRQLATQRCGGWTYSCVCPGIPAGPRLLGRLSLCVVRRVSLVHTSALLAVDHKATIARSMVDGRPNRAFLLCCLLCVCGYLLTAAAVAACALLPHVLCAA